MTTHWEPHKYEQVKHDGQQVREYRSEWGLKKTMPDEPLMNNPTMAAFLQKVAADQWFRDRFGDLKFALQFSKRRKRTAVCNYQIARGFTLKFPGDGCMNNRITALHELMHVACHRQAHGPVYCAALLQVVIHYMGLVAGNELRHQFAINSVYYVR